MKIELELHRHLEALVEALGLGLFERDYNRYYGFAKEPNLEVFYRGEKKGKWWIKGSSEILKTMTELIHRTQGFSELEPSEGGLSPC